ncbi:hypothetical protein DFH08DRAFT_939967 [Mycena albidolilacea]|uniref:Uncharacterized protein n=1 Tax=Mycena albidolilacea TaxID=1033008 RepID=A0AAD6ZQV3_9AGAR|nr:hypothetical protein DFH08DRAFT_939908 [Mycena albidolilacea]KAJ7333407.1 hypothetical protein DFH08DRAFT_939967 [Mycena albidolilacea]
MAPDAKPRSPADQEYLDSLSGRQLMDFRNCLFSPTYIKYNAGQFLDHDWVNIDLFREYLQRTGQTPVPDASSTPSSASDNDSWETGSGRSVMVTFAPVEAPIECRRARSLCRGCTACDKLDPALRNVVRFELDPAPRDTIIIAQQETRRREGNTPEERASIFIKIIRCAKCLAVNSNGRKCEGGPILKAKPQGTSRGDQYFFGCSGWTPKFQKGYRTHSIPDHVNENLDFNALAGSQYK